MDAEEQDKKDLGTKVLEKLWALIPSQEQLKAEARNYDRLLQLQIYTPAEGYKIFEWFMYHSADGIDRSGRTRIKLIRRLRLGKPFVKLSMTRKVHGRSPDIPEDLRNFVAKYAR
jgi:hypothetical protein